MLIRSGLRDHRLRDEARCQRKGRTRQCADRCTDRRDRHAMKQPAEIGALAQTAGLIQHRPGRHQQECLVDDVREGVRGGAVQRHLGADTDAGDHEPDLIDDRVRENPAHVVFEQRVNDAVEHHEQTDVYQQVRAGKAAYQHVNRRLGRESGQKYRAAPGCLGVGIRQPGGERWRAGIQQNPRQHQCLCWGIQRHRGERDLSGCGDMAGDAGEQEHAAEQMNQQISSARGPGRSRV